MQETSSLHRQAASALNIRRINIQQESTLLQRLKPNPERMNLIGKYLKNGAIAAAGTGGVISIANAFQSESDPKESSDENVLIINITTSTVSPEHDNPLGVDK